MQMQHVARASYLSSLISSAFVVIAASAKAADQQLPQISAEEMEQIKRKAELQKQAGSGSRDLSYMERLKAEQAKQKSQKTKTKAERRDDLCEVLGRGC
jgi:hypothetical protein